MKITQIMLAKGFGGAERHFVDLSLALAARGVQVQAICEPRFEQRQLLEGVDKLEVAEVPVLGSWDTLARRRIGRLMNTFGPAVVQVHLGRAAHLGGHAARRLGIPVVANTHNFINLDYFRAVDHFSVPTLKLMAYLASQGVDPAQTSHIPHFTEPRAVAAKMSQQQVRFGALGRFVDKKGFHILIDALHRVRSSGVDASLTLAGDGPNRDPLQRQATELGLGEFVNFCGWVAEPGEVFDNVDVFVLPSLAEPFGIVVIEAMAAGLPIISTRTDGPLEILDEQCAYFADIGDCATLSTAMCAAANDAQGRSLKAQRAAQRFTTTYTTDATIPSFLELYTRLSTPL